MMQLRWVVRLIDKEPQKILQYRQEYDVTVRAQSPGQIWREPDRSRVEWGPWTDVPVLVEGPNPDGRNMGDFTTY